MGTYTTNKNLFMPTVGETGWGTLVNGNFETIDNFLKPITVSGSTYTFTGNQTGGSVSATSITNSGTLTQTGTSTFTGKITANGGIGTKALTTTSISNSGTLTQTGTSTFTGKITANGGIGTKALTATTGTFSGAVTGSTFNGQTIGANSFNGMPIGISFNYTTYNTSTYPGCYMYHIMGSNSYQYIINDFCGYITSGQKSLYVPRLINKATNNPQLCGAIYNISLPSDIVAQLRIVTTGSFYAFTYSISGAFTKSGTISTNTTYINLTNAEVNAWCKKGITLTTNGAQNGSTVMCALYYTGSTANKYFLYITD